MPSNLDRQQQPAWLVWAALLVIYLVWGSTYLAIRVAVATMPPLLTAGVRFFVAGLIILAIVGLRRGLTGLRVTRTELVGAGIVGAGLVAGGNGLVMLAERDVPSALAALIIASVPLWVVVLRTATGQRVARGALAGVLIGFVGVAVLVLPAGLSGAGHALGLFLLVAAAASWASGSFLSQRLRLPADLLLSTALQMTTGGLLVAIVGLLVGEGTKFDVAAFAPESLVAVAYLLVFGSLLAFTAYSWLLQNAPISQVATYAYVNPVVAVILGWAILAEEITPVMLAGAVLIVASVAVVVRHEAASRSGSSREASSLPTAAQAEGA